jgi:hypothetical protein
MTWGFRGVRRRRPRYGPVAEATSPDKLRIGRIIVKDSHDLDKSSPLKCEDGVLLERSLESGRYQYYNGRAKHVVFCFRIEVMARHGLACHDLFYARWLESQVHMAEFEIRPLALGTPPLAVTFPSNRAEF